MNRKIIIISGAAVLTVALVLTTWCILRSGKRGNAPIFGKIHLLKESTVPMRFKIVAHDNNSMVLTGKFFDLDGNAVGRFECPYDNDGPISMQFHDVEIDGRHIIFPGTISLSEVSDIELAQYYSNGGVPSIYNSRLIDTVLRNEIGEIFQLIVSGDMSRLSEVYGNTYTINTHLAHPCERVNYEILTTSSGRVIIDSK